MKRLIKVIVFSTLVLLSACGGQGIEVSNPTPSIPTSTPKKVDSTSIYGFINMIDLNGAPVYKLVFLKDKRIALQLIEGLVIIQNYTPVSSSTNAKMASSSGDTGAIISFNPIVPGQGALIFSLNIGEAFNLLRATVTENNELLELTSENNLGAAQKDIQGNYTPFNSGSCNHFGKKLVIQQVETQFKIEDSGTSVLYTGQMEEDNYLHFTGSNVENQWACEGSVVNNQMSGVCIPDNSESKACTFFLNKRLEPI